jgi:hypothetical protein
VTLYLFSHLLLINDWERRLKRLIGTIQESEIWENDHVIHFHCVYRRSLTDLRKAHALVRTIPSACFTIRHYRQPAIVSDARGNRKLVIEPRNSLGENETIFKLARCLGKLPHQGGFGIFIENPGLTWPDPLQRGKATKLFEVIDPPTSTIGREDFWFQVFDKSLDLIREIKSLQMQLTTHQLNYYQWWGNSFWISQSLASSFDFKTYLTTSPVAAKYGGLKDRHSFIYFPYQLTRVLTATPFQISAPTPELTFG